MSCHSLVPRLSLVVLLALLSGCEEGDGSLSANLGGGAFWTHAVPAPEEVTLRIPEAGQAGALVAGETGELYLLTWRVSAWVNAHAAGLLGTLRAIVELPPTSGSGDVRVWGPSQPGGLDPASWRLTLEREDASRVSIRLEGRSRNASAGDPWIPVIFGHSTPESGAGRSAGSLTLDFDAHASFNPGELRRGRILLGWDTRHSPRTVTVDWDGFVDERGLRTPDAGYTYEEADDRSGKFRFVTWTNIHEGDTERPGLEHVSVVSSWRGTGAGQSTARITGDEIVADLQQVGLSEEAVTVVECWDDALRNVYADTLPELLRPWVVDLRGEESACQGPLPEAW